MDFKEFFRLNEERLYVLTHSRQQGYSVIGPATTQQELKSIQAGARTLTPDHMWTITIDKGQLHLPTELEPHREDILYAYFKRFGMQKQGHEFQSDDSGGDIID